MAKNKMLQAVVSLAGTIDPSLGKALDDVTGKLENVNWKAVAVGGAVGGIAVATGKAVVEAGKYLADLGNEYNTAINQLGQCCCCISGSYISYLCKNIKFHVIHVFFILLHRHHLVLFMILPLYR